MGPVYNAQQIVEDPHYQARGDIIEVDDPELGATRMLGLVPKFSQTPGSVEHTGPSLGEHNALVYRGWLGYDENELKHLNDSGII